MGFMSTLGSTPAAKAWANWARADWSCKTGRGEGAVLAKTSHHVEQTLAVLGEPAGDARIFGQAERGRIADHKSVRQQRTPELATVANANEHEIRIGRPDPVAQPGEAVSQESARF
jgi:hypothetical protein